MLVKPADVLNINDLFYNCDKNLRLIGDCFENEVSRFLDIKVFLLKGQQFTEIATTLVNTLILSYTPWNYKISWIQSLAARAKQICSVDLPAEIHNIKKFESWSRFPNSIRNLTMKRTLSKSNGRKQLDESNNTIKLYLNLYYSGEQFVQICIKKLKKNIRKKLLVKFVVLYNTIKAFLQIQKIPSIHY